MFGDELEDLKDDLSGLSWANRIGVDAVRGTDGLIVLIGRDSGGNLGDGKGEEGRALLPLLERFGCRRMGKLCLVVREVSGNLRHRH